MTWRVFAEYRFVMVFPRFWVISYYTTSFYSSRTLVLPKMEFLSILRQISNVKNAIFYAKIPPNQLKIHVSVIKKSLRQYSNKI